jgi:benzylsuccinate CoA-transferase BbsE subunit
MTKGDTALEDLRVIELANECGVYCGKLLVGMGANVIKVERPGGATTRSIGPFLHDDPHPEKSLQFAYHNTGKKSITLNIETKDGKEVFKKLVQSCDVLVETSPVGYMDSLGLGYTSLKKVNPKLVMTSITPFGQTGPNKDYKASSEIIPLAMGGLMFTTGEQFTPPVQVGNFLIGYAAGIYAALGTIAAIHNRRFTGKGEHVDISMQECVASWLEASYIRYQYCNGEITTRFGSKLPSATPSGLYPCKDGYYCVTAVGRWNFVVAWLISENIDVGDLADPKYETMDGIFLVDHRDRIYQLMRELGMKYTKMELMIEGQKRGVPVTIMGNAKDVYEDEHLKTREYFVDIEHPLLGKLKYPGAPYKMSESPWRIDNAAPLIGEHNEEVYTAMGFSRDDLVTLKAAKVI